MIEELLPDRVAVAEALEDPSDGFLFPEEEALLARAVDKRRREFTTGRLCARRALARLGLPASPILRGPKGQPQWPDGISGSITHCAGYRAAAAARAGEVPSIGIDAEPHDVLPDGVLDAVSLAEERSALDELGRAVPGVSWDRLLFSAKESVYKAWYPLAERWLGFEDAVVTIHPDSGTFEAKLLVAGPRVADHPLTGFAGRWLVRDGLVVTAIAVPGGRP